MSPAVLIGLVAAGGVALAPLVSKIIRSRSKSKTEESGPGDPPGSPDRGPGGMHM